MKLDLDTKIIGKRFLHHEHLPSTNTYAYHLLSNSNPIEGTAIIADYQSAGKGQYGRKWSSNTGENLLTSVIVMPKFLLINNLHMLNVMLSISVCQLLSDYGVKDVSIKWPNDILVTDHKIAGLLIQNNLQGALVKSTVLGVGLNVNQDQFDPFERAAVSMYQILGFRKEISEVASKLYHILDVNYQRLQQNEYEGMITMYNNLWNVNQKYCDTEGQSMRLIGLSLDGLITALKADIHTTVLSPEDVSRLEKL